MNTAPRVSDLLRKFQEARLAEAEVFSELVTALAQAARTSIPGTPAAVLAERTRSVLSIRAPARRTNSVRRAPSFAESGSGAQQRGVRRGAALLHPPALNCSYGGRERRARVMFSWPVVRPASEDRRRCGSGSSSRTPTPASRRRCRWWAPDGMGVSSNAGKLFLDFRWEGRRCREFLLRHATASEDRSPACRARREPAQRRRPSSA